MRPIALVAILALTGFVAAVVVAADPEPSTPASPPVAAQQADPAIAPAATPPPLPIPPMIAEIEAVLTRSRSEVADLAERFATADPSSRDAISLQVAQLKQQAELDILAIQARHARLAGNEALALEIEAAIAIIVTPPPPPPPAIARPAPGEER